MVSTAVMVGTAQMAGALLLLAGFVALIARVTRDTALAYLAVNTAGSAILATVAAHGHDWGFLALEGTWAVVSLSSLLRRPWRGAQPELPSRPGQRPTTNPPLPLAARWTVLLAVSTVVMVGTAQMVGAVLLLAGFVALIAGVTRDTAPAYLAVNTVGSAILAAVAALGHDWGFLMLHGTWAVVSLASVLRRPWRQLLPPEHAVHLAGDELSQRGRVIRLYRDSYSSAQGRQWLQPQILWWDFLFLRRHGIRPDWDLLESPELAERVTSLDLPAGHVEVYPAGQASLNFRLWWSILGDLARRAYRPHWLQRWPLRWAGWWLLRAWRLPDTEQVEARAWRLGLRPWMSSATDEEMSGLGRALAVIDNQARRGRIDDDQFMLEVLLPGLLRVELHWLHAPGGRPRTGHRVDVVLLRRYDNAVTKSSQGHYLTPSDHMYLRAGELLRHLSNLPGQSLAPAQRAVVALYRELDQELVRVRQHNHTTPVKEFPHMTDRDTDRNVDQAVTVDPVPRGVYDGEPITGDISEHVQQVADRLTDDAAADEPVGPPGTPPHS